MSVPRTKACDRTCHFETNPEVQLIPIRRGRGEITNVGTPHVSSVLDKVPLHDSLDDLCEGLSGGGGNARERSAFPRYYP